MGPENGVKNSLEQSNQACEDLCKKMYNAKIMRNEAVNQKFKSNDVDSSIAHLHNNDNTSIRSSVKKFKTRDNSRNDESEDKVQNDVLAQETPLKFKGSGSPVMPISNIVMPNWVMMPTKKTMKAIWKTADCVCFDVDSTVCVDEGIDELARFCGKTEEVSKLTLRAMEGHLSFHDALRARLNIIDPTLQQVSSFIQTQPPRLTPGIRELVRLLHERDTPVYLISGGFRSIIGPIAKQLRIPKANLYANRIKFFFEGEYAGFEESEPTAHSGGKADVIRMLKEQHGYNRLVMIGDGMTDLETCPPADAFIGFGGNQVREMVKDASKWYVMSFEELIVELKTNNDSDD
jgi:phosphoserine phosphatase